MAARIPAQPGADDHHIVTDQGALRRSLNAASARPSETMRAGGGAARTCRSARGFEAENGPESSRRRGRYASRRGRPGDLGRVRRVRRALPAPDRGQRPRSWCRSRPRCWCCSSAAPDAEQARRGAALIDGAGHGPAHPARWSRSSRSAPRRRASAAPGADARAPLQEGLELLPAIAGTQLVVVLAIAALPGLVILLGASLGSPALVGAASRRCWSRPSSTACACAWRCPCCCWRARATAAPSGARPSSCAARGCRRCWPCWRWPACSLLLELRRRGRRGRVALIVDRERRGEAVAERVAAAIATILAAPFVALGTLAHLPRAHRGAERRA